MKNTITFDKECTRFILEVADLTVGRSGQIIHKSSRQNVLGLDDKPVKIKDFAGLVDTPDGMRAIRKGIVDVIHLMDILDPAGAA